MPEFFTDISEHQGDRVYDATYPNLVAAFRYDSGYRIDFNADANWKALQERLDTGQVRVVIAYLVYVPGNESDLLQRAQTFFPDPPERLVLMIDMESGSDFAGPGDHSDGANELAAGLAGLIGDFRRVIAYANAGDFANNWPRVDSRLKQIVASYGSEPGIAFWGWQYTDGRHDLYPPPDGYPDQTSPIGACDHNVFLSSIDEIEADLGITGSGAKALSTDWFEMATKDDLREVIGEYYGLIRFGDGADVEDSQNTHAENLARIRRDIADIQAKLDLIINGDGPTVGRATDTHPNNLKAIRNQLRKIKATVESLAAVPH